MSGWVLLLLLGLALVLVLVLGWSAACRSVLF